MHLWDRLLPQATITWNLLRPHHNAIQRSLPTKCWRATLISIALPWRHLLAQKQFYQKKTGQHKTWKTHHINEWYLGPALEYYRCYRDFTNKLKSQRNSNTVGFCPQHTQVLVNPPLDVAIVQATRDLIRVLQYPTPCTPYAHIGHDQMTAMQTILADIFQQHLSKQTHSSLTVLGNLSFIHD
jgi:hypothetical protein